MKVMIKIPFAATGIEPTKRGTVLDIPDELAEGLIAEGKVEPVDEPKKTAKKGTKKTKA